VVIAASDRAPATGARPRDITILGSTGSIGTSTLDLVARSDAFRVDALTAHRNVAGLADQARRHRARLAVIADPSLLGELRAALAGSGVEAAAGPGALTEAASGPADFVMAAIVGAAGLEPTFAAVERGASVGLANKECLVAAGALLAERARQTGAMLLPVDSEHSAIFQVLDPEQIDQVERLVLTASGGPFRDCTMAAMAEATPADALAHPNWDMGAKVTIDSATMMNKGFELIEAHHLFAIGSERLDVVVHPQSIVHSMVAYRDGSVLAQLGEPDMRTPIAVALAWPNRMETPVPAVDLARIGTLTFERPDLDRFPALGLARAALEAGGGAATVLNAANEVAVAAFLAERIGFLDIARLVERALDQGLARGWAAGCGSLHDTLDLDRAVRRLAREMLDTM
jgi:1-deoxy-D-xylulose-5-phosphate reductoisomerase